ncbi:MAG: hypothetical protein RR495_01710 [Anaerovoracaceae bacterium]
MAAVNRVYERQINRPGRQYEVRPKVNTVATKNKVVFTAKEKKRILLSLVLIGAILIGSIIMTAFAANLAYHNNQIRKENSVITGDIETLKIEIQSSNNIGIVEEKAIKKLGMINPEGSGFVEVEGKREASKKLATGLKKRAFN